MTAAPLLRVVEDEIASGIWRVPAHLRAGVSRYLRDGDRVGHFLTAVLQNDLREAVGRADDTSIAGLRQLIQFLHNHAPSKAWGSPEAVEAWIAQGGARGKAAK